MTKSDSEKSTARESAKAQGLRFRELMEVAGSVHRMGIAEFSERAFLIGHYRATIAATEGRLNRLSERTSPPLRTAPRVEEWREAVRMIGVEEGEQERAVKWIVQGGKSCPQVSLDAATIAWLPTRTPLKRRIADQEKERARAVTRIAQPRAALEPHKTMSQVIEETRVATGTGGSVTVSGRTTRLPSTLKALLADVRDKAVTVEEAERVLGALLFREESGSFPASPPRTSCARRSSEAKAPILPFPQVT